MEMSMNYKQVPASKNVASQPEPQRMQMRKGEFMAASPTRPDPRCLEINQYVAKQGAWFFCPRRRWRFCDKSTTKRTVDVDDLHKIPKEDWLEYPDFANATEEMEGLDINEVYIDGKDALWYDGSCGWSRFHDFFGENLSGDDSEVRQPVHPWNCIDYRPYNTGPITEYDIKGMEEFDKRLIDVKETKMTNGLDEALKLYITSLGMKLPAWHRWPVLLHKFANEAWFRGYLMRSATASSRRA